MKTTHLTTWTLLLLSGCGALRPQIQTPRTEDEREQQLRELIQMNEELEKRQREKQDEKVSSDLANLPDRDPCPVSEAFAHNQCWNFLRFSDTGSLSLHNGEKELVVMKPGGILPDNIAKNYEYSESKSFNEKMLVANPHLRLLSQRYVFNKYWFLPTEFATTRHIPQNATAHGERALKIKFSLTASPPYTNMGIEWEDFIYGFLPGEANICGQALTLPLLQKDLEKACAETFGEQSSALHKMDNMTIEFNFTHMQKGMTSFSDRKVLSIEYLFK